MNDNNLDYEKSNDISKQDVEEEKKASCLILRDLAIEFEEQLYNIKNQINTNQLRLQEKEIELKDIERTNDHNLDLFSPIHNQTITANELIVEIDKIKNIIKDLEQKEHELSSKIYGLKTAVGFIDSHDEEENNDFGKSTDHIQNITEKGLGILEAQEIERQRIARDLHDITVQNLTSLVHKSELCNKLIDIDVIRAKLELSTMANTLKMIINDMRGIIYNLKPMTLDDLGLTITIQRYANRITNLNNIHVKVSSNEEPKDILPVFKLTVFRIIQEACNNIIKHANATLINIDLNYQVNRIIVNVKDNGVGFNINKFNNSEQGSSFGLSIMKERISLLSGSLDIYSECGKGTLISVSIPLSIYEGGEK